MLLPSFIFSRFNNRANAMPCKNPCDKCKSKAVCGHLDRDDAFPFESDNSPLARQQEKWLNSSSTFYDRHCALHPESDLCRIYD